MTYARNGGTVIAADVRADAAEETATIIRDEGGPSSEATTHQGRRRALIGGENCSR